MAMREKLIELIETTVPREKVAAYGEVPVTVGQIADHLIANGVIIQKWIPVTERLPDTGCMYIVTVEKLYGITYSDVAYFDALSKKWGTNTHHYSCDKVTHWMPIPKPPKGE